MKTTLMNITLLLVILAVIFGVAYVLPSWVLTAIVIVLQLGVMITVGHLIYKLGENGKNS